VINTYANDPHAQELLAQLAVTSPNAQGYSLHQGIIRQGEQIWIGDNSTLRTKFISTFHSTALGGGHSGIHATYKRIKTLFVWNSIKTEMENFVKQCPICQHAKTEKVHPPGLLQPLPILAGAWQDLTLDFIESLPNSEGYNCILVIVDIFS
jgi:hypothetical protein